MSNRCWPGRSVLFLARGQADGCPSTAAGARLGRADDAQKGPARSPPAAPAAEPVVHAAGAVTQLENRIRGHARAICAQVFTGQGGECDFATDVAADLPMLPLADVLCLPQHDRRLLFDWAHRVIGYQDRAHIPLIYAGQPTYLRSELQHA